MSGKMDNGAKEPRLLGYSMKDQVGAGSVRSNNDVWVALGVIFCLGLGASITYWLTSSQAVGTVSNSQRTPIRGQPINSVATEKSATPAAVNPATVAPAAASKASPDYMPITFDVLGSYYYELPDPEESAKSGKQIDQIPAPIKEFDGKKVAIQGFMIPLKLERGATKTFLFVKCQLGCCFGRMPRMNEWISVRMTGDRSAKFIPDQPVTVYGVLSVGEQIEKGEVLSVYRLEAEDVAGPMDL